MSNKKSYAEQIEAAQLEIKQKEAFIKQLKQKQKDQERKDRTHRLCKRGGMVESMLPDLIKLSDEQFEDFVEKCLLTGYTAKIISKLLHPELTDEVSATINEKVNIESTTDSIRQSDSE